MRLGAPAPGRRRAANRVQDRYTAGERASCRRSWRHFFFCRSRNPFLFFSLVPFSSPPPPPPLPTSLPVCCILLCRFLDLHFISACTEALQACTTIFQWCVSVFVCVYFLKKYIHQYCVCFAVGHASSSSVKSRNRPRIAPNSLRLVASLSGACVFCSHRCDVLVAAFRVSSRVLSLPRLPIVFSHPLFFSFFFFFSETIQGLR